MGFEFAGKSKESAQRRNRGSSMRAGISLSRPHQALQLRRAMPDERVSGSVKSPVVQRKCSCSRCGASRNESQGNTVRQILRGAGAQSKLKVGEAGDRYEQQADRVADQVLRMPDPQIQRKEEQGSTGPDRSPVGVKPSTGPNGIGGQQLSESTRSYFEPRFGHDFGKVRVHTDQAAAESAHDMGAHAYTFGGNIVFGKGQYRPTNPEGQRLLAHELAHVAQQGAAQGAPRIQRWAYGAGVHVTGGGANLSEFTAAERAGSNGLDVSMRIVDRVVNNATCRQWFVDNCTDVPTPTLVDLNNRAVIWMWRIADGAPAGNNGLTDGAADENHAINERLFNRLTRWAIAATMVHEYWHDCETGQPDIGDDAKAACGLPNI